MKKWFQLSSVACMLFGGIILNVSMINVGIIQILAMILIAVGGIFSGLVLAEDMDW